MNSYFEIRLNSCHRSDISASGAHPQLNNKQKTKETANKLKINAYLFIVIELG
jgi:hypothetical protein